MLIQTSQEGWEHLVEMVVTALMEPMVPMQETFITVHESDLDTLACVFWDLNGGRGGLSGTHGQPGEGGIGGHGENGGRCNRYGDRTYTVTRGADAPGPQGPPGIPPATYLSGGEGGKQGSSQIRVIKSDLTEATFPKRYMLKVGFLPGRMSQMAQTVILAL